MRNAVDFVNKVNTAIETKLLEGKETQYSPYSQGPTANNKFLLKIKTTTPSLRREKKINGTKGLTHLWRDCVRHRLYEADAMIESPAGVRIIHYGSRNDC
jgi:hypothetical protein